MTHATARRRDDAAAGGDIAGEAGKARQGLARQGEAGTDTD